MHIQQAEQVDVVILLSGDGDFQLLLQKVRSRYQVESEVYGVPGLTSQTLIHSADRFTEIDQDLLL